MIPQFLPFLNSFVSCSSCLFNPAMEQYACPSSWLSHSRRFIWLVFLLTSENLILKLTNEERLSEDFALAWRSRMTTEDRFSAASSVSLPLQPLPSKSVTRAKDGSRVSSELKFRVTQVSVNFPFMVYCGVFPVAQNQFGLKIITLLTLACLWNWQAHTPWPKESDSYPYVRAH